MGHAAVTARTPTAPDETFARGGVGQAGVETAPFLAWIDNWQMRGLDAFDADKIAPLELTASAADFSYALRLDADRPLVLQGDKGFSRKSDRGQASYYYSQPFFKAAGRIVIDEKPVDVTGLAWMDREWSSQPLAADQTGWDWFSLHLDGGEKLMLYRLRQKDGRNNLFGNFISPDGRSVEIAAADNSMTPTNFTDIEGRKVPTSWRVTIPAHGLNIETVPINPKCWMGTSFAYWEGPITFRRQPQGRRLSRVDRLLAAAMNDLSEKIIAHYQRHASDWDADRRGSGWNDRPWHEQVRERCCAKAPPCSTSDVAAVLRSPAIWQIKACASPASTAHRT